MQGFFFFFFLDFVLFLWLFGVLARVHLLLSRFCMCLPIVKQECHVYAIYQPLMSAGMAAWH